MGHIEKFEDIIAWQKGRLLCKMIYELTMEGSFKNDFAFKDQIRRASISINSNIAEGFGRTSDKEFAHFLSIAKGSCTEVKSQLYTALDLKYISQDTFSKVAECTDEIGKLLTKFIQYLRNNS